MATYFHGGGSEIQASENIQTLYLMNPNYLPYSESQNHPTNMLLLNSAAAGNPLSHHHHLLGVPLPQPRSDDPSRSSSIQAVVPGVHYAFWDQNSPESHPQIASVVAATDSGETMSPLGFRQLVVSPTRQGLSLSLSSRQQQPPSPLPPPDSGIHGVSPPQVTSISPSDNDMRVSGNSPSSVSAVSTGVSGMPGLILGSKYLRAAQELLDEVVCVGKGTRSELIKETRERTKVNRESPPLATVNGDDAESSAAKRGAELTTAQRQELQMKKAKLVSMLDEVEQRYKQYHHNMQMVVSSFEQAAGFGSAKSYTALALQTISKQFRCLKDAITAQIKATSKSMGEEDCLGARMEGSRLRYIDNQMRQQRALQQLGMVQHNAWRPQRGLPERAVSVLRAWLFEHFLHPYPKDSDKHTLAKQTGLTRSQVSNWFINARVRLWKPMVEEMYLEEIKDKEKNNSEENKMKSRNDHNKDSGSNSTCPQESASLKMNQTKALNQYQLKPGKYSKTLSSTSPTEFSNSTISTSVVGSGISVPPQTGFNLIEPSSNHIRSPKKPRNDVQNSPSSILSVDMDMKQGEIYKEASFKYGGERLNKEFYSIINGTNGHGGGFGEYPIGEIGRFNTNEQLGQRFSSSNGVSLSLGLPHCEKQNFLSNHSIHLGRGLDMEAEEPGFIGINSSQASHSSTGFEGIDIQNRKRFAVPLLPDFVA